MVCVAIKNYCFKTLGGFNKLFNCLGDSLSHSVGRDSLSYSIVGVIHWVIPLGDSLNYFIVGVIHWVIPLEGFTELFHCLGDLRPLIV